jgi:LysM repeat protein
MKEARRRLGPVAAGGLVLAALGLAACSLGTSGATAPTSTIPSTAFRTIPVSPPKPTEPTVAAAATTAPPASTPLQNLGPEPGVKLVYTVQNGDCCPAKIAAKFNVPLEAFYAINGMDPKNPSIVVGQEVKIPRILPPTTVLPTGEKAYQVVPNDSLLAIANKFGIDVQLILDLNGLQLTSNIAPGQMIKLPG